MGKAKKITVGFKYFMGLFMGVCRGPVNAITEIRVGGRTAWKGEITNNTTLNIDAPELFGGTKAEGGVQGPLEIYMGSPTQTISQRLKNMLGGLQPEYRGVLTMYFDGMVSAMSPYPKDWTFKMWRTTAGWIDGVWYAEKCTIEMEGYDGEGGKHTIKAMNPAHILYECQTNYEWGRGLDRSLMDEVAFRRVADTLFDENFGLCIRWARQDTLESFIQMVLDHIGGVMYVSKITGKYTIKLIRDDFVAEDLPIFDANSGLLSIEEATNASPASMINEVIVEYVNPIINETQQVRCHNLAQIQNQGSLNSVTTTYVGVPTGKLAMQLAQRDLRVASTNVRRFSLILDRRAWSIQPADVFKIRDPNTRGISEVIVRVGSVEDGTLPDGKIKIVALQDQFAFRLNTFNQVQPPDGYKPDLAPALARRVVYEMPYIDLVQQIPEGEFNTISPNETFVNSQAEKPTPMSAAYDMGMKADGEAEYDVRGNGDFGAMAELSLAADYLDTVFTVRDMTEEWEDVVPGNIARIAKPFVRGDESPMDLSEEFVEIVSVNGNQITVKRGVIDTIPFRHQVGELLWVTTMDGGSDWQRYGGAEAIDVKILPWTLGGGRFKIEDAPVDHLQLNFRQTRPYAPGRATHTLLSEPTVRNWFMPTNLTATANAGETPDVLTLNWAHRDRVLQADKPVGHIEPSIGPEPGTSYTIEVFDGTGSLVRTESGITGTSWVWPYETAAADVNVEASQFESVLATVRLTAVRSGFRSWEYYDYRVEVFKKPPQYVYDASLMHQAVQPYNVNSDPNPTPSTDGPAVASFMHAIAQPYNEASDPDPTPSMSGPTIALMPHQVTQESSMISPLDTLLFETPYLQLARDGEPTDVSTVSACVARSSDRTVDSYTLFTKHQADENYFDAGVQPWTPWGMTAEGIGFFNDEIVLDLTSDKDGVPLTPVNVGDLLLIDREILSVKAVDGKRYTVGRGCADTIPAQHYSQRPVWLISTGHGYSRMPFGDTEKAMVIVRPDTYGTQIPLNKIYPKQLEMQYRAKRPYPPGMMMIGGVPFFNRARGLADDFDPYKNLKARDVLVTYAHRNRISQGTTVRDHFAVGINPEPGVHYRVRIGYGYYVYGSGYSFKLLKEFTTEDAGFTIAAADIERWGLQAGRAQQSAGWSVLTVSVNAERDGMLNWQGYEMQFSAPSYPLPPGEKPGGNNGSGNNGGGTTPPVEPPDRPDPSNPGGGGGDGPDEPKPPVDPVDPENPDTDPPLPPDPEPDPGPMPGWSISWDHGWATTLPDQRYVPEDTDNA